MIDLVGEMRPWGLLVEFVSTRALEWADARVVSGCLVLAIPADVLEVTEIFDTLPDEFLIRVREDA